MREKGLIAVKHRFKSAAKCVFYLTLHLQVKRSSTHFTQRKKKEKKRRKNAVNLVLLPQKQEMHSTYLTL